MTTSARVRPMPSIWRLHLSSQTRSGSAGSSPTIAMRFWCVRAAAVVLVGRHPDGIAAHVAGQPGGDRVVDVLVHVLARGRVLRAVVLIGVVVERGVDVGEAGLLVVDAGHDEDAVAVARRVHRRLDVLVGAAGELAQPRGLEVAVELVADPLGGVGLADDLRRAGRAVLGDGPRRAVGKEHLALGVGSGGGREQQESREGGGRPERAHAGRNARRRANLRRVCVSARRAGGRSAGGGGRPRTRRGCRRGRGRRPSGRRACRRAEARSRWPGGARRGRTPDPDR